MVILIKNIALSEQAAPDFQRKRLAFKAREGEVFALVWVFRYVDAAGVSLPGFKPGYMCGPVYSDGLDDGWALAQLPDGSQFHFMPRFRWSANESYVVDQQGFLFSIGPLASAR